MKQFRNQLLILALVTFATFCLNAFAADDEEGEGYVPPPYAPPTEPLQPIKQATDPRINEMDNYGATFSYSPTYDITAHKSSDLNSSIDKVSGFGIGSPYFTFSFRWTDGTIPHARMHSRDAAEVAVTDVNHKMYEGEFMNAQPLLKPHDKIGPFALYMPLVFGVDGTSVSGGGIKKMSSYGVDLGAGLGARFHTSVGVVPELSAIYHIYNPSNEIEDSAGHSLLKADGSKPSKRPLEGLEIRFSLNLWVFK